MGFIIKFNIYTCQLNGEYKNKLRIIHLKSVELEIKITKNTNIKNHNHKFPLTNVFLETVNDHAASRNEKNFASNNPTYQDLIKTTRYCFKL